MRILIVGDGLIGSALRQYYLNRNIPVSYTSRKLKSRAPDSIYFDLSNKYLPKFTGFTHAIITASITGFKTCEENPVETKLINIEHTVSLARHLVKQGCHLTYLSSTAVFSNNITNPNENTKTNPTTEYGIQKEEVEKCLLNLGSNIAIARLTKVLSLEQSFFNFIYNSILAKSKLELFENFFMSPISLDYLCSSLSRIIEKNHSGIFHLSNADSISYADFAKKLAKSLNVSNPMIVPTHASENQISPTATKLDMLCTKKMLSIQPETITSTIENLCGSIKTKK